MATDTTKRDSQKYFISRLSTERHLCCIPAKELKEPDQFLGNVNIKEH